MLGIHLQSSLTNLSQADRVHQNQQTLPVINQEQNSEVARQQAAKRPMRPVEPDKNEAAQPTPKHAEKKPRTVKNVRKRSTRQTPKKARKQSTGGGFLDVIA